MKIPDHLTITEDDGKADCTVCRTGLTAPESFGGIDRADLLASFVIQHAVHNRVGNPTGLTVRGAASKAALAVLGADQ